MPLQPAEVIAVLPMQQTASATSPGVTEQQQQTPQPQRVTVRTLPRAACAACAAGHGCGAGLFSRLLLSSPQLFQLNSDLTLVPGDQVLLQAAQPDVDRMAMLWYGLPLLLMLLTASLMQWALTLAQWPGRPWVDLAVLLALLGGLAAGWWLAARRSVLTTATVSIVRHWSAHVQSPMAAAAIEESGAGTNIACRLSTDNRLQ